MNEEEIIKQLTATTERAKSNTRRLDEVVKKQDELGELVTSVATIAAEQKAMNT